MWHPNRRRRIDAFQYIVYDLDSIIAIHKTLARIRQLWKQPRLYNDTQREEDPKEHAVGELGEYLPLDLVPLPVRGDVKVPPTATAAPALTERGLALTLRHGDALAAAQVGPAEAQVAVIAVVGLLAVLDLRVDEFGRVEAHSDHERPARTLLIRILLGVDVGDCDGHD